MTRVSEIGTVLALGAMLAGCQEHPKGGAGTSASSSAAVAAKPVGSVAAPLASASVADPPHAPLRGPGGLLFAASKKLPLDDAQKLEVKAAMKPMVDVDRAMQTEANAAVVDLRTALASHVKAGAIDNSKLGPSYDALEKSLGAAQTKDAEAVNALHATLTPEQRRAVAADLHAEQASVDAKIAKRDATSKRAEMSPTALELQWLTGELGLDEVQQKRVDALVANSDPSAKQSSQRFEDLLKDFAKDAFDAKTSALFQSKSIRESLEERSKTLDKITKLLTPEQREKLASKIVNGPTPEPGMAGPGGPMSVPGGPMSGPHDGHAH